MLINKGIKAKPTGLTISNQPKSIRLEWPQIADPQRSTVNVYWYPTATDATNDTNRILIASEVKELSYDDNGTSINGRSALTVDTTYGYRITSVDIFGNESLKSDPATIAFRAVETTDIKDLAITAAKIQDAILTAAKFASTLQPVENFATVAAAGTATPAGRIIFVAADSKLYKAVGGSWAPIVNASDMSGQLTNAQIAALDAAKLTGTLDVARIATGAIDVTKFASSIRPVEIFATTAAAGTATAGRVIYVTADNKLYRGNGTSWVASTAATDITGTLSDAQIAALAASKITGQIVGTQITDGEITTAKMTANTIDGSVITANTLNASKILAGSITSDRMTVNTINGNVIAAGTLDASKITADSITAGQIAAGAIATSELAAGAVTTDKLAVGVGNNYLKNSDFTAGLTGWVYYGSSNPANFSVSLRTDTYAANGAALEIRQINTVASQYYDMAAAGPTGAAELHAVVGNNWYELSTYFLGQRTANITLYVRWFDAAGAHISWSAAANPTAAQNINPNFLLSGYQRAWGKVQAPSNARSAVIFFRHNGILAGQTPDSYLWIKRPYFSEAEPNQTEASPWSEGGYTMIQGGNIVTGAILTSHMTANTIDGAVITANTLNASKIVAGSITSTQFTANTINGNIISAGTLNADKIIAGTIQSDRLAVNAITGRELLLGDFSNIADAGWSQGNLGGWGVAGLQSFYLSTTVGDGDARGWMLQSNERNSAYSSWIAVNPGDVYYFEAWVKNTLAASTAYIYMNASDESKANLTWTAAASTTTIGSWIKLSGQLTVPVGKYFIRMGLSNSRTAGTGGASIYWSKPVMRRAMSGNLIVDGAITASKISVSSLDAISGNLGTLQVGSANILDSAILPSKFFQRDFTNGLLDPDFVQGLTNWGPRSGTGALTRINAPVGMMPESLYAIQGTAAGTTAGVITTTKQNVVPDKNYIINAVIGPGLTSVAATVAIKVKWYQERNGVLTGPYGGVEYTVASKTESTGSTGLIRIAGNIRAPSGQNKVEIICECTRASGPVTITVGNVGLKRLGTIVEQVGTAGVLGPFNTGVQTAETISLTPGYMASSVAVWGAFRNRSGAARTFDIELTADAPIGVFVTFQQQKLADDEYGFIFGRFFPLDNVQYVNCSMRVQCASTGNSISHTKMTAMVDTGQ